MGSVDSPEGTSGSWAHTVAHHQLVAVERTGPGLGQLAGSRSVAVEAHPSGDAASWADRTGLEGLVADRLDRFVLHLDERVLHLACARSLLPSSWLSTLCLRHQGLHGQYSLGRRTVSSVFHLRISLNSAEMKS